MLNERLLERLSWRKEGGIRGGIIMNKGRERIELLKVGVWGPRKKDEYSGICHIDEQNRTRLIACSVSCTWLLMMYFKCW